MESKMQELYDYGDAMVKHLSEMMVKFEGWFLSIPDVDETLIESKVNYFHYENPAVEQMWDEYREKHDK